MHRVNVSLLCLISLSLAGPAFSQTAVSPPSQPAAASTDSASAPAGVTTLDNLSGGASPSGTGAYFNIRHMTGAGVGYQNGYTQIGGVLPFWGGDNWFIGPDTRVLISDNGTVGANLGGLGRIYSPSWDRIFGAYGYFDTDQGSNTYRYNQGSVGVESLGTFLDVRANGYFPTGNTDNSVSYGSPICVSGNPYYQGNNIVFQGAIAQNREQAMQGYDFEFGIPLSPSTPWLRGYAGAYWYNGSSPQSAPVTMGNPPSPGHQNPVGFRGRVDAWISDDLLAGVNVTTDPVWGTNVNAVIDFRFAGWKPTRFYPQWVTRERMLAPVQRNWRIAVQQYQVAAPTPVDALNPTTGKPYFVDFVNSAAAPGGNGTFEHPFSSTVLPSSFPQADIIIVERGNSTAANPYTGSVTLANNQILLGEGAANVAPLPLTASYGACTVNGNFALPGIGSGSGNYPFISNGGGIAPIITLANNNEVAGFNLLNSGGSAIVGNNINNFNLHDMNISNNAGTGISIMNGTGTTTIISNINIPNAASDYANPNGVGNNAGGGILVTSGLGGIGNLQITNVNMNSNAPVAPGGIQPFGISLVAGNGPLTSTLTNVNVTGNTTGLSLTESGQTLVANLIGVNASGNTQDGVDVSAVSGTATLNATNSTSPLLANNNGRDGLNLSGSSSSITNVNITDGQLNDNGRDGVHNVQLSGSVVNSMIDPSSISGNGHDGFYFNASGGSVLNATFLSDTLDGNNNSAFDGFLSGSKAIVALTNTAATDSVTGYGFQVQASGKSFLTTNITGISSLSQNAAGGIYAQLNGGSTANFNVTNSTINSNAGGDGVLVTGGGSSNFNGSFDNTSINFNGLNGVKLNLDNSPNSSLSITDGSTVNGNGSNGVLVNATTSTGLGLTFSGITIQGNGTSNIAGNQDGVQLNSGSGSTIGAPANPGTFTGVIIQDNLGNGLETNVDGPGSSSNLVLTTTQITGNTLDGLLFTATTGGQLTAGFSSSSALNGNGQNAINGTVTGTGTANSSSATITLDNVNAGSSGSDNVILTASQGGLLNFTGLDKTSMSNSANGAGLLVNVSDVNTVANINLTNVTVNGNATVGFGATATDTTSPGGGQKGATLNVCLSSSSFSLNADQGLLINVTGPGAVAYYGAGMLSAGSQISVNQNGQEGLLATATNLGEIDYRSIGSMYNGNGTSGTYDGASFLANNANIRALFYGGSTNNNTGDGLAVGPSSPPSTNGSNITLSMGNSFTSSGNTGDALNFDANGANTAYLQMYAVNPPVLNGAMNLDFTNVGTAVVDLTGTFNFNGQAGDGFNATFANANTVIFSLVDPTNSSTADGNGADGLNINVTDVTNASILIQGFKDISNNTGDGIHIGMTNVTNGALELQGVAAGTTVTGNGGNGINMQLSGVNLVNNFSSLPGGNPNIIGLTIMDNQSYNACLPLPVPLVVNSNAVVPATGLTVNNFTVSNSGSGGIDLNGTNVKIANGGSISNDTVSGSQSGDGINVTLYDAAITGATANGFLFDGNSSSGNTGNGINFQLTNVAMNDMSLTTLVTNNNTGSGLNFGLTDASVIPSASLTSLIASSITANANGGSGVNISADNSQFFLNAQTIAANGNGTGGTGDGFTASATNGSTLNISLGSAATASSLSGNANGAGLNLTVNDSTSYFNVDNLAANTNGQQGLTANVVSTGSLYFRSVGDSFYTGNGTAGTYDGVHMQVGGAGSTLLALFDGGQVSGSGDGFNFGSTGGANLTATLQDAIQVSSTTTGNYSVYFNAQSAGTEVLTTDSAGLDKFTGPIYVNDTGAVAAVADLNGKFTLNSGAAGVNGFTGIFDGATTAVMNLTDLTNSSTASGNGGDGIHVSMDGVTNASVQVQGFTDISSNTGNGVSVSMSNATSAALNLQGVTAGTTVQSNGLNGIDVQLNTVNLINTFGATVTGPTYSYLTTGVAGSNQTGSPVQYTVLPAINTGAYDLTTAAPTTALAINNFIVGSTTVPASGNALGGIIVDGTSVTISDGEGSISNNTVGNNQNGDGIQFILDDTALVGATANDFLFNNNTAMNNNGGDGINVQLTNVSMIDSQFQGLIGSGTTGTGNGIGINLSLNATTMTDLALTTLTASNNVGTGLNISLANGSSMLPSNTDATSLITSAVTASGNAGGGVSISADNSQFFLDMGSLTANSNTGGAGLATSATNGSTLNISLDNPSSVSGNGAQGLSIFVDNSTSIFNVNTLTANGNGQEGLLAAVQDGGTLYYRSLSSTYDGNGTSGTYDGVNMQVDGATSTLLALFDGGSAGSVANGGNTGDGFHFGGLAATPTTLDGATLTATLQDGVSAVGNGGYALNFDAPNAANANLLIFNPVTLTGPININDDGVSQAVVNMTGNFAFNDNTAGDGLSVSFSNAALAIFNLNGLGTSTADGNSGNGINVSMTNVTDASVNVQGMSDLSSNGLNGINVSMTNTAGTTTGAVDLQGVTGQTTVTGNGQNGVNVQLSSVSLINNFGQAGSGVTVPPILQLTTGSDQPTPPTQYGVLPAPISQALDLTGIVPTTGLTVNNFTASNNTLGGIIVDGTNTSIANGGSISSDTATSNANGDGIQFILNDATASNANGFLFNNNTATNNVGGDGINVQLTNVSMNTSQFEGLTGSGTTGAGNGYGINLNLTGSTMTDLALTTLAASNNAGTGLNISLASGSSMLPTGTNTTLEASTITASSNKGGGVAISVNDSQFFLNAQQITANSNTGGTGFAASATNGSVLNISLGNGTTASSLSSNTGAGLSLTVNDSTSLFNVDNLAVNTNTQQGLLANVSNTGILYYRSVGDSFYTGNGTAGTFDGVNMQVSGAGSTLLALFDGGKVSGTGDGFNFGSSAGANLTATLQDGVTASSTTAGNYSVYFNAPSAGTEVLTTNATGTLDTFTGPIYINDAGATNAVADLNGTFTLNNNAAGDGLYANFNGATTAIFNLTDPSNSGTATGNTGGNGINVSMNNVQNASVLITGFTDISNNNLNGVNVSMLNTTLASPTNGAIELQGVVAGTTVNNNGSNGINVQMQKVGLINLFSTAVTGPTYSYLTTGDNQAAPPAQYTVLPAATTGTYALGTNVPATGLTVNNFSVGAAGLGNGLGGIIVDGTNTSIANGGSISSDTATSNANGDGIQFILNDATASNANGFLFNNNTATNNVGGDGINVQLTNVSMNTSQFEGLTGSGTTGAGNGYGINLNLTGSTMTDLALTTLAASNNAGTGLNISLASGSSMLPTGTNTTLEASTITASSNKGGGVAISVNDSQFFLNAQQITANSNTGGTGFAASATNGSVLNISLGNGTTASSLSSNTGAGLSLTVNDSTSSFNVDNLNANTNTQEGLLAVVQNAGTLYYRSVDASTYNGNGTSGTYDGVNMQVNGATSTLLALFDGGSANTNSGDGFHFGGLTASPTTVAGATLTATIQNGAGSKNNTGYAINFDAPNAKNASLLFGNSILLPQIVGSININESNATNAVASLVGTFTLNGNTTGDGLTADFDGAKTAIFNLSDPTNNSNASNNTGGDGINVSMNNVTNGSVIVTGFTDISHNKGDGISVSMLNTTGGVTTGAVELLSTAASTTTDTNGGDGINVQLGNVNLINNFATTVTAPNVLQLTTTNDHATPPTQYGVLPAPVTLGLDMSANVPATGLTVNNFDVSASGLGGIIVDDVNTVAGAGSIGIGGSISQDDASGSAKGDGIQFILNNAFAANANQFLFNNDHAMTNVGGDGINVQLTQVSMNASQFENLQGIGTTGTGNGYGINLSLTNATLNDLALGAITTTGNAGTGLNISLTNSSMIPTAADPTSLIASFVTASQNGGDGVSINLNNSQFFLDTGPLTANNNTGGAGFTATATNGSTLNISLDNPSSVTGNSTQGLSINLNDSTSWFNVNTLTANTNGQEGMLAVVQNGSTLYYRSVASTYNGNGTSGTYDGVNMQVDGATSTLLTLFDGGSANNNTSNGFQFGGLAATPNTVDGATVTVSMTNGLAVTGNTGYSIDFNVQSAANANLLMDSTVTTTGSANIDVSGATNEVILQLTDLSFNGSAGDGLTLDFDNGATGITNAFVSLDGLGTATINGNAGNGVNITMNGLTNGSVNIVNYASISTNTDNGVLVSMTNVANGAVNVSGSSPTAMTAMSGNGDNGVNVVLSGTNLVNGLNASATLPTILGLTAPSVAENQPGPPTQYTVLPLPTALTYGASAVPATSLTLDNLDVTGSGSAGGTGGIVVTGTNSSIASGSAISGNIVLGSTNGDGIDVLMTNTVAPTFSTLDGLVVNDNFVGINALGTSSANHGNGIFVSVTNNVDPSTNIPGGSTADNIQITNNTVANNFGTGITLWVDNTVTSTSTANNVAITGNTIAANGNNGLQIDALNVQMAGLNISNNTVGAATVGATTLGGNNIDGIQLLLFDATWTNLTTSGNTIDGNSGNGINMTVTGSTITTWTANDTAGGDITSNGLNGLLITASGTSSVTGATFTGVAINKNGSDGVNFNTTDTTTSTWGTVANPITFTGGSISDNGAVATGNGVNLNTLLNGSVANLVFTNEAINNTLPNQSQQNGLIYTIGDGTTGGTVNAAFTGGSINNNAIDGINATINGNGTAAAAQSTVSLTGTTIDGNGAGGAATTGFVGALFSLNDAASLNLTVQNNGATISDISGNGSDGLQINATGASTTVVAAIHDSTILNNGANDNSATQNGITGNFDNGAVGTFTIDTGSAIGNTSAGGTQQNGIVLNLNQTTPAAATSVTANITSSTLNNNAAGAMLVNVTGVNALPTNGANITFNAVTATGNGGIGVTLNANAGGLLTFLTSNNSTISGNGQYGLYVTGTDADTLISMGLVDTLVNNNGSAFFAADGLNATALNGATVDLEANSSTTITTNVLGSSSFSGNTGSGLDLLAQGTGSHIDVDLHTVDVGLDATNGYAGNTLNGLKFQVFDGGQVNLQAYETHFDGNGGAGLIGAVNDTAGVDTGAIVRIVGGEANDNTGSAALGGGYNLSASNTSGSAATTATMTAYFQADENGTGVVATGNTGYGLSFITTTNVPTFGGVVGNLLMTDNNTLSGNTAGSVNVNMNGASQAIVGLSGTFDDNTDDGIDVSLSDIVGLGLISVQGGGTGEVNGNGGNGINVTMTDVNTGGVFIGNFNNVSDNGTANGAGGLGQNGITVTMTDVGGFTNGGALTAGVGALTIDGALAGGGQMAVSNNSGTGINVLINGNTNGGSIINNGTFSSGSIPVQVIVNDASNSLVPPPPLPNVPLLPGQLPLLTLSNPDPNATTVLGAIFTAQTAIQNVTLDSNGTNLATANGITFGVDGAATSIANNILINNDTITNTGTGGTTNNGVVFNFTTAAIVTGVDVTGNTISDNHGDGFQMLSPDFHPASPVLALNFTANVIDSNTGNGVDITLQNANVTTPILNLTFINNDVSSNGSNGLFLDVGNMPTSDGTANVFFTSNTTNLNTLNNNAAENTFNDNGGMGAFMESSYANVTNASTLNLTVGGTGGQNTFNVNENAGIGINVQGNLAGTATIDNAIFSGNLTNGKYDNFDGTGKNLFAGDGMSVVVLGTVNATYEGTWNNSVIGGDGTPATATAFSGNVGDGLRMTTILSGEINNMTIQNTKFSGNGVNGTAANGQDGISFARLSGADPGVGTVGPFINNVIITNNIIQTNVGNGINLDAEFGANGEDTYTIVGNTIGGGTIADGLANSLGNGGNGINLHNFADANMTTYIGQTNPADGTVVSNTTTANTITNNGGTGIMATQTVLGSDIPLITSYIVNNTINANAAGGINYIAIHQLSIGLDSTGAQASNYIDSNGFNNNGVSNGGAGISISGSSNGDQIQYNAIDTNGGNGITINAFGSESVNIQNNISTVNIPGGGFGGIDGNGGTGIQLQASNGSLSLVTIDTNDIKGSGDDGIALLAQSTPGGDFTVNEVQITNNNIWFSGFRGVSVVNGASDTTGATDSNVSGALTTLNMLGNDIVFSQYEGVYIVNTSTAGQFGATVGGTVQGVDSYASSAMAVGTTTWFNDPRLSVNMTGNTVQQSGASGDSAHFYDGTTGVMIQVGSSEAMPSYLDTGLNATSMTSAQIQADGIANTLAWTDLQAAGVVSNITKNVIDNNFGNDVAFNAYTSTAAPPTTTGTWYYLGPPTAAAGQYSAFGTNVSTLANQPGGATITSSANTYVSDPLARLDLNFAGNTVQGVKAVNYSMFFGATPAYYNNAEGVFKSRVDQGGGGPAGNGGTAGDTAYGPFNSATRDRMVTSLAAAIAEPNGVPNVNNSGIVNEAQNGFLYSGVGASTFQVNGTADTNTGVAGNLNGNFYTTGANTGTTFFGGPFPATPDGQIFQWDSF